MRPISLRTENLIATSGVEHVNSQRRRVLQLGAAGWVTAISLQPKLALAAAELNVTSAPFSANPASTQDSSPAFQAALSSLSSASGGVLHVPPGVYYFDKPLTYSGRSLTILGAGKELSVFVIRHTKIGLTVNLADSSCCLTVRDIGATPMPGGDTWTAGAIACIVSGAQGSWQNCLIEDVDFGVPFGNFGEQYSSFYKVVTLQNTARARINNCNAHGNLYAGGIFLDLQGGCNHTRIDGCNIDGYVWGFVVSAYSQGLHIIDTVFIGGTALQTGVEPFNGNINLLGLYISGCELNCNGSVFSLYQVQKGWIGDTDIYGPRVGIGTVACELLGSQLLTMHNLSFGGFFSGGADQVGIFATSSANAPSGACKVSNCQFENTGTAVFFDKGTFNFVCSDLAMYQAGTSALVNTPIPWGTATQQVYVDNSGNTTNDVSWLTTTSSIPAASTGRMAYER